MSVEHSRQGGNKTLATSTPDRSLFSDVCVLWFFLLKRRPGQIALLLFIIVLAAIMEMVMLAAVVPLMSVLISSDVTGIVSQSSSAAGVIGTVMLNLSQSQLLLLVVLVVLVATLLRILVVRLSTEFSVDVGMLLQTGYFRILLHCDYELLVNQSSSENLSMITQKIQMIIANYILGSLTALSALVSATGVLLILVWFSNPIVLLALVTLAVAYLLIAAFIRGRMKHYGRDLQQYNPRRMRSIQEGLGGIRDVVMTGSQEQFIDRFAESARRVEKANARIVFFNAMPKPLLEAIGICSIAAMAWANHQGHLASDNLLPFLGVFALGMLRLLPYMQQIFGQWTRLVHGHPVLAELIAELEGFSGLPSSLAPVDSTILPFTSTIKLHNVGFHYLGVQTPVLSDINMCINKGEYIGIVGPTGSGKSTLVDMLMGLLPPTEGIIQIDNETLTADNRDRWRRRVAHVPQKLFLTEASVSENIAFGVPIESINRQRVERCAIHAHLHQDIVQMPSGYDTRVGEDGVRLSGGQRQRIGIARALYSQCDVLVLDEATNALDTATERAVVDELLSLDRAYTIIAIAHNLDTVTHCHRILTVGQGCARWRD